MPFDQVTVHPSTKATQTTPEKDEAEEDARVCLEIEVEHMHGDKVVNKGKVNRKIFQMKKKLRHKKEKQLMKTLKAAWQVKIKRN
uniref:Uncharacterized protein n=1 Tax=Ditylenchus dipsaci TaxID=166011 RepID=A0A915D1G5_9BILA